MIDRNFHCQFNVSKINFIQSANLWKFGLDWQSSCFLIRLHFMYTQHMFTNVNHQSCCNFISFNIRISFKVNSAMLFPIFRKGMTISFFVKRLVYISHHQGEDVILKGVTKVFDGYLLKCQIIFSCKVEYPLKWILNIWRYYD